MCVCVCVCVHAQSPVVSNSLQLHGLQPSRLLCPWDSPGKNARDQIHVSWSSCISRWILYHCTMWEAPGKILVDVKNNWNKFYIIYLHSKTLKKKKKLSAGISLAVQWLVACTSTGGGRGQVPVLGTKIQQAKWCGHKK